MTQTRENGKMPWLPCGGNPKVCGIDGCDICDRCGYTKSEHRNPIKKERRGIPNYRGPGWGVFMYGLYGPWMWDCPLCEETGKGFKTRKVAKDRYHSHKKTCRALVGCVVAQGIGC